MDKVEEDLENNSGWKRPDQVMKLHRFKLRKNALQARIRGTTINNIGAEKIISKPIIPNQVPTINTTKTSVKRKNPFLKNEFNKKPKESVLKPDIDINNDSSTFELLKVVSPNFKLEDILNTSSPSISLCSETSESNNTLNSSLNTKIKPYIPIDWTLKTKIRLMSMKPFAWKGKLKTSEEASGTTGFVRCLDIGENKTTLDTSPNARFHQCCLVWQHPSIPWLDLYPRSSAKVNIHSNSNTVLLNQYAKQNLYLEWCSSFRSLFHLLRVRQCPYFYVCGNNFTVLFRAAGVCGMSEIHALLTPTTSGLRKAMQQEEIQFTMPLKKKDNVDTDLSNLDEDYELNKNDDDEQNDTWLKSVGIEESEINKINSSQTKLTSKRECEKDNLHESLILVIGVEVQALFNFLMNCKTLTTSTGPLANIPPTILSPVAFHGATLKPLKVRENTVFDGKEKYYSLEISGPILPAVIPSLRSLINSSQLDKFSISCAHLPVTVAFSLAKHGKESEEVKEPPSVFGLENLTDCGFSKGLLEHFCDADVNKIQSFESLSYSNDSYTWK